MSKLQSFPERAGSFIGRMIGIPLGIMLGFGLLVLSFFDSAWHPSTIRTSARLRIKDWRKPPYSYLPMPYVGHEVTGHLRLLGFGAEIGRHPTVRMACLSLGHVWLMEFCISYTGATPDLEGRGSYHESQRRLGLDLTLFGRSFRYSLGEKDGHRFWINVPRFYWTWSETSGVQRVERQRLTVWASYPLKRPFNFAAHADSYKLSGAEQYSKEKVS